MIYLRSTAACGYRRDGGVLIRKGDNALDDGRFTQNEAAFVRALVASKVAREITEAEFSAAAGTEVPRVPQEAQEALAPDDSGTHAVVVEEPRRAAGKRRAR